MKNKFIISSLIGILAVGSLVPAILVPERSPQTVVHPNGPAGIYFEGSGEHPATRPAGQPTVAVNPPVRPAAPAGAAPAVTPPVASVVKPVAPKAKPHPVYPYRALMTPNSSLATVAPFVNRLSMPQAWGAAADNPDARPVIAVVDTGFNLEHENLVGRFTTEEQAGWDFIDDDEDPSAGTMDPFASAATHGTMVAGLVALMDPTALIMPLQALDDRGSGTTDTVASAIHYAADRGADVISLSLGTNFDDDYLRYEINYAISKGALVIAAAGNDGCNCMVYPAAYPEVLAVGASDAAGNRAAISSYGPTLDVLAPGVARDVCSDRYNPFNTETGTTCAYSGTSLATPIVAGLAGLLLNQVANNNPNDLMRYILTSATKKAPMNGQERTDAFGHGVIAPYPAYLAASTADPTGQFINVNSTNLVSVVASEIPFVTACGGVPGATCRIELTGPDNTTLQLGIYQLDEAGNGSVVWDPVEVEMLPGNGG